MRSFETRFDGESRLLVPAALMAAAGLEFEEPLSIVVEPGRLVIETTSAALNRVRANIVDLIHVDNAVQDLSDDAALVVRNDARRAREDAARPTRVSATRGQDLLAALGVVT